MELFDAVVPPLATAAAIGTYAGSLLDARSWKEHGTGTLSYVPYGMLLLNAGGWVVYGIMAGLSSVVVSNVVGLSIAALLCFAFVSYSREPVQSAQVLYGNVVGYILVLAAAAYFGLVSASVVGTLCSGVAILMFASPLATLRLVLATKSAASLPAPMVILGLCCTVLWTAYGLRQDNVFMYVPNGIAMVLGIVQVALLIVYADKKALLPV